MPLYEYQCEACGHRFEVIRKFSDAPLDTCPRCSGVVRKLQSAPAFQFKGSGWYITDYARKGEARTGDAAPDAKPDGNRDRKPETTGDKGDTKRDGAAPTKTDSAPGAGDKPAAQPAKPSTTGTPAGPTKSS